MRVRIRAAAGAIESVLLPALCVACDGVLAGDDRGLCGDCRSRLAPLSETCCPRCGTPADMAGDVCLSCLGAPPPQLGTVLWGAYDGPLRLAVLALKHRGHDEVARTFGRRLAARIGVEPWFDDITAVTAVPSHPLRRLRRGYCAAELLADTVARLIERPYLAALRRHGLHRQRGRTRRQRMRLARGSFSARREASGRRWLIVDDVCTTGTTFRRAAETLVDAGAAAVYCAAVAHAPDPRRL
ncbi:MAG: double zinc ribbon domain-containing protein [Holophagae bacterium]